MSLWTRLTTWREARKAVRRAIAARKQQDRARAMALGAGAYMSVHHGSSGYEAYHGSSGSDCSPGTSGDCSGTGV
jgi:hypothetical protein